MQHVHFWREGISLQRYCVTRVLCELCASLCCPSSHQVCTCNFYSELNHDWERWWLHISVICISIFCFFAASLCVSVSCRLSKMLSRRIGRTKDIRHFWLALRFGCCQELREKRAEMKDALVQHWAKTICAMCRLQCALCSFVAQPEATWVNTFLRQPGAIPSTTEVSDTVVCLSDSSKCKKERDWWSQGDLQWASELFSYFIALFQDHPISKFE